MSQDPERTTFYTDLDSLFDLRLGVLRQYGDEVVHNQFKNDYANRNHDEFPGVDLKDFRERYANRSKRDLRHTAITPVITLLEEFNRRSLKAIYNTPYQRQPRLMLNIHPFKLSEAEVRIIVGGIQTVTENMCDVQIVEMPLDELTPLFVKRECQVMVMYDYCRWMDLHAENGNWSKVTCPTVQLLGPALYKSESAMKLVGNYDPFTAAESLAAPFIRLVHRPVSMYSLDLKRFVDSIRRQ